MERIILKANEGYIFTDDTTYGTTIYLAVDANPGDWYEIPLDEYLKE